MSEIQIYTEDDVFDLLVEMWQAAVPLDAFCSQLDGNPDLFKDVVTRTTYIDYFIGQFEGPFAASVDQDVLSQVKSAWLILRDHGGAVTL